MHKDKINEIQKEMGDKNHTSSFNFVRNMLGAINGYPSQYIFFVYIIFFFFVILPMLGPIANLTIIEEPTIQLINLIGCFFYIIVICGLFGRCTCCCFYRPSNWIFIMFISIFSTIVVNITVIIMSASLTEMNDNKPYIIIISAFNTAIDLFVIIPNLCKIYDVMKDIYRRSREYEINIIKKCVMQLVNELKNNNI